MSNMAYQQKAAIEHMRDPYKTLGVRQDADVDEIKAAWRSMAKAIHPDHNRDDPTATARFAEVGRAYETLKDPKKRSRYDQVINMSSAAKGNGPTIMQQRQAAREADERAKVARAKAERLMEELERANAQKAQKAATASAAQPSASPPPAADSTAAPETAEDMVERIFGARAAAQTEKPTTAQKAADAPEPETTEPVPPEAEPAVATSTLAAIIALPPFGMLTSLVRRITGAAPPVQEKAPEIAAEAGITLDDIIKAQWITVPLADGKEVRFQAVAGMSDGQVVHLKGQGLKLQGMLRGDVAVTVHLEPHERFSVKGFDLHTTLPVTIENAVLGWETSIEGPRGRLAVSVPPWSGSDHTIRIPGEGLANDEGGKGDLVVELRLMLWGKPDHKMTDLMRSMKDGLFL